MLSSFLKALTLSSILLLSTIASANSSMSEIDIMTREAIEFELAKENITVDFFDGITDLEGPFEVTDPASICDFETTAIAKWMEGQTEITSQCVVCFVYLDKKKLSIDWQEASCL